MPSRRSHSTPLARGTAHEMSTPSGQPKSVELEQRLSRLELEVRELTEALALERRRTLSLRAELDHCIARTGRRY